MAPRLLLVYFGLLITIKSSKGHDAEVSCGPERPLTLSNKSGYFLSPNYHRGPYAFGHSYPGNSNCSWSIKSDDPNKVIRLFVWSFHVDGYGINCNSDMLDVYDSSEYDPPNLIGRYCGTVIPEYITSRGPRLFITFRSDAFYGGKGFNISYEIVNPPGDCPKNDTPCRNGNCVAGHLRCDGHDDCGDGTDETGCGSTEVKVPTNCGQPKIRPNLVPVEDRVVGGKAVIPGSWPYVVQLRLMSMGGLEQQTVCGATLINDLYVLTAGHCFKLSLDISMWTVHLGCYHKYYPTPGETTRYIVKRFLHPDYIGLKPWEPGMRWQDKKKHDIALLKLNAPVEVTKTIQPACLPQPNYDIAVGSGVFVLGWGDTRNTGYDTLLKQGQVLIYSYDECKKIYPGTLRQTMLCAGRPHGGTDSCHGDSGGPLMATVNGKWTVIGIVSYGARNCAEPNKPGVYTDISDYVQWINSVMYNKTQ